MFSFSLLITQISRIQTKILIHTEYSLQEQEKYFLTRQSVHRVKIMVEKVPEFSSESLCLRHGIVTSGRWCHMIHLGQICYHPLTKAERFCRKFGNFFHHTFDSVYRMSHQKLCFQSPKNIHSQEKYCFVSPGKLF